MTGSASEREARLRDLLATLEAKGKVARVLLAKAAVKKWLVGPAAANSYLRTLEEAGYVANDYGYLTITKLGAAWLDAKRTPLTEVQKLEV